MKLYETLWSFMNPYEAVWTPRSLLCMLKAWYYYVANAIENMIDKSLILDKIWGSKTS